MLDKDRRLKNYKKYFNFNNLIIFIVGAIFTIPFILIFIFVLNKKWFDGLSVAGAIYIAVSLLAIIFNFAQFKHFKRIKDFFVIKKEDKQPLTKFEQEQMRILGVRYNKTDSENIKEKDLTRSYFLALVFLIYGLIILIISLPFLFI